AAARAHRAQRRAVADAGDRSQPPHRLRQRRAHREGRARQRQDAARDRDRARARHRRAVRRLGEARGHDGSAMTAKTRRAKPAHVAEEKALRAQALSYPGTQEAFPWGERVVKVRGKVFVFMGRMDGGLGLSVKLPGSASVALALPFASPTGYGLGKSG